MGLPSDWVEVPGLTREMKLRALGNGVVPQQAELAIRPMRCRRKTNRKARPLSISADALCDMAAESDRKRELELQAEALQYKQEFDEINAARLRRGALPIPWHIYCRDRAIGIFAEKDLQK